MLRVTLTPALSLQARGGNQRYPSTLSPPEEGERTANRL